MARRKKRGALTQAMLDDAIGQREDTLPIADLKTDGGTQPRASLDDEAVTEYRERLDGPRSRAAGVMLDVEGVEFPAVTVFYDGTDYWLTDGFHRVAAAQGKNLETIKVTLLQGSRRDAILHSMGVNAMHGKRRTNADKRRIVSRLLSDPEWGAWADSKLAKVARVSNKFVGNVRRELVASGDLSARTTRIGADGRAQKVSSKKRSRAAKADPLCTVQSEPTAPIVRRNGVEVEARTTPQVELGEAPRGETEETGTRMPDLPEQSLEVQTTEQLHSNEEKWALDVFEPKERKDWYHLSERLEEARWVLTPLPEAVDLVDAIRYPANVNIQARAYVDVGARRWIVWGDEALPTIEAAYEDMGGLETALGVDTGGQG